MTRACVFGCSGPTLTQAEADFFRDVEPWGFILFGRNIENPDQVRGLVEALRGTVGRSDAPVLIDQEGGRVARLRPPHWRRYPPAAAYAAMEPAARRDLARLGGRLIAQELSSLGINVDCAPVVDVARCGAHEIIGDRAYGPDPKSVSSLARAFAEGLIAGGVLPVIKHIPGHGRAMADSHLELPVVSSPRAELEACDFAAFRFLSDMPMAMTAHVVYAAIDPGEPATTSRAVIEEVIRRSIGFDGLLLSDDLSMQALSGDIAARARDALAAGCDMVIHCNGDLAEMTAVAEASGALAGRAAERAHAALARIAGRPEGLDILEAAGRFEAAFAGVAA